MASKIDNFLRWVGNHLNHLNKVAPCTLSLQKLKEMKSILIISENNTSEQDTALEKLRKEVSTLSPNAKLSSLSLYRKDKKSPARISAGNSTFISQEDFNIFYKFKSEELKNIINQQYDIVLVSSISYNKYISYILPFLRTVLMVGCKSIYENSVNIMIDSNTKSIETYNKEALANIKMIFGQNN
ncbi:MAG: hypothetical protein Q4C30_04235 [Bacteroidia bacterium]|nr:hypothetical protein [Bacteroidia bacterium]